MSQGNFKLTRRQVRALRQRYAKGGVTQQQQLAREYGITQTHVSAILLGKTRTDR